MRNNFVWPFKQLQNTCPRTGYVKIYDLVNMRNILENTLLDRPVVDIYLIRWFLCRINFNDSEYWVCIYVVKLGLWE